MRYSLIAAALVMGALCLPNNPASAAPAPCSISLTVADPSLEASVTSDAPAAVQAGLTWTVDKPDAARASATFTASVDAGWVTTPSPSSLIITNQHQGFMTVTAVVPAASKPSDVGIMRVEAAMTAGGVQCTGSAVEGITITPLPYFNSLVGHAAPANVTLKNGAAVISLAIGAKANVPVALGLEYTGPPGISLVGPSSVSLPTTDAGIMNGTASLQIHGVDLMAGTYQITVKVHGTANPDLAQEATVNVPLIVPQPPDIATSAGPFLPLVIVAAVAAGVAVWWKRRS